ncbi:MAG: hypothetical protein ACLFRP_01610 [Puniceicoccaceae bacterium]
MDHPFAEQCQDLAKSILWNNLGAINEDGSISPLDGEDGASNEPGHAALAIGEYHRATGETTLEEFDLVDLAARAITAQVFDEEQSENGLAYAGLGLLSFGPAKDRNAVWARLVDETREALDKRMLMRSEFSDHRQAFNIAKAVTRFSLGLTKKDETGRLIERFLERIKSDSTSGFFDDAGGDGVGGAFDIYGILSFVMIRQSLQLHANLHLRDRKLPSLRTHAEKYVRMMPDLVRQDGLGWAYGENIGAYGQMHCISIILQALRDDWITPEKRPVYLDVLRRLFQFFFETYVDQERGLLVIRDGERSTIRRHTSRMANFDAARYLSQWSRLARSTGGRLQDARPLPGKSGGKFTLFDRGRRENGLFSYSDASTGLHLQIPLVGNRARANSDSLAFPHSPGVFDWPCGRYLPVFVPELDFGGRRVVPCYYGKGCVTGLGRRNSIFFSYEQPELITMEERILPGLGSCKVRWEFNGSKIQSEFAFEVKTQTRIEGMRYVIPVGIPHSRHRMGTSLKLGEEGLRPNVLRDDFQGEWQENEIVSQDPGWRTYWGPLFYLQTIARNHPLVLRPGQIYRFAIEFDPDLTLADA